MSKDNLTTSPQSNQPYNPTGGGHWCARLVSRSTGEIVEIDSLQARVSRMQERVRAWASYCTSAGLGGFQQKMITLTYAAAPDGQSQWRPQHIREFMGKVRRHCGSRLLAYAWVAELQERGEVHYHVLLILDQGAHLPYPDRAGWWVHGMSRIEVARSLGYVVKYAQKGLTGSQSFPAGLRLFAVWVVKAARTELYNQWVRVKSLPSWLRPQAIVSDLWPKRALGGGWHVVAAGVRSLVASPYQFLGCFRAAGPRSLAGAELASGAGGA